VDLGIRAEIEEVRSELARTDALFDASSRGDFSHAHDTPVRGDVSHARDTPSRGDFNRDGSSRGVSSHRGHSRHEPSRRERSRQRSRSPKAEASHTSGSTHRQRSPVIGRGIREAVSNLKAPPGTEVDEPCTHCLPRHGLRVARSHYAHECAQLSNPIRSDDRRELRNAFLRRKGERKPLGGPKAKAKEGVADSASADAPVTAPTSASIGTIGSYAGAAQPSQPSPPAPVTGADGGTNSQAVDDAGVATSLVQRYFMLAMATLRQEEPEYANSSERELVLALRDRSRRSGVFWHAEDVSEEMFALCEAWLAERGWS